VRAVCGETFVSRDCAPVADTPETHYTRSADGTNLAYQVSGDGPLELVFLHGVAFPIDLLSEEPGFIRLRKRLATFSRTIWFEMRGMGASEGPSVQSGGVGPSAGH
jgi:pimeloyl-ACP methyl ester carboxylesterase